MKIDKEMYINGINGELPDHLLITEVTKQDVNNLLFSAAWHEVCLLSSEGGRDIEGTKASMDFVLNAYRELVKRIV